MSQITTAQQNGQTVERAGQYARRTSTPSIDIFENADEVRIVADVPGFGSDGVDVRIEHDTLKLETKVTPPDANASPALSREFDEVQYARSFRIPAGIDTANIHAESRLGTVVIRLPKAAAAKARKIAVQSG